jgi:WD40 repeat protein
MSTPAFEIVTVAIGAYDHHPPLEHIDLEAEKIIAALRRLGGVAPNHPVPQRLDESAVKEHMRRWVSRAASASGVLVWLGHGASDGEDAWLATSETPNPINGNGIVPKTLADQIDHDWRRRGEDDTAWSLVVIEACGAEIFVNGLLGLVAKNYPRRLTLVGVGGHGAEFLGHFSDALNRAVDSYKENDEIVRLVDFLSRLEGFLSDNDIVFGFRPNQRLTLPRERLIETPLSARVDVYPALVELLAKLSPDERSHYIPKGQGAEHGELAWYFVGRAAERRRIADWLHHSTGGILIVTGRAGAGKSALLGNVFTYTIPGLREVLVLGGHLERTTDVERPPDNVFDAVVHLTGVTTGELVRRLADAAGVALPAGKFAESGQDLEALLAGLRDRPFTILADALDEAQEPATIASTVLRRLAALPRTRIVVGTRASTKEGPDQPYTTDQDLLVALGRANTTTMYVERDPEAVASYVRRRLAAAPDPARRHLTDEVIEEIVTLVGEDREFLFARLAVHEIIARPGLLSRGRRDELETLLSGDHRTLFAAAVARLTTDSVTAGPLLEALAFARGRGVPRADRVWALIAGALTGYTSIREADIDHLLEAAAPYVMLDGEDGQSVYRLAHRTFQEFFIDPGLAARREPLASADSHRRVAYALIAWARDSGAVNPYIAHRLAEYVADGEAWDDLAEEQFVLDRLEPESVAAEALRTGYGRADLPLAIAASLSSRHLLSMVGPEDRAMTRHITMACIQSGYEPFVSGYQADSAWARLQRHDPLHVRLTGHNGAIRAATPVRLADGRVLLATGGDDLSVRLWDPSTGRPVGDPFVGAASRVLSMATLGSSEGRTLVAIGGSDGNVRLWDPDSGQTLGGPLRAHSGSVLAAVSFFVRNQGSALITCGDDGKLIFWKIAVGRPVNPRLLISRYSAKALARLSLPDHVLLVTGGYDAIVWLWDPLTGQQASRPLVGSTGTIHAVETIRLPNGQALVAAGGEDAAVRLWDPVTSQPVGLPLTGHQRPIHALAAVPLADGRALLASAGEDATVRLWDPVTSQPVGLPLTGHQRPIHALAALPLADGRTLLASAGDDGTVRLWDPSPARRTQLRATPRQAQVLALATVALPGNRVLIATGDDHGVVQLLDPITGEAAGTPMFGGTGAIHAMSAITLPDGRTILAVSGANGSVTRWDAVTALPVGQPLVGHTGAVLAMAAVALKTRQVALASAGHDDKIRLWDPVTGRSVGELHSGGRRVVNTLCAVSVGERPPLLASAGADSAVLLWDPATTKQVARLPVTAAVTLSALAVVSSPNSGAVLAAGGNDGSVFRWDARSLRPIEPLAGSGHAVLAMAGLTSAGHRQLLAVSSADGAVRVWDLAESRLVRTVLLPFDQRAKNLVVVGTRPPRLVMRTEIGVVACEIDAVLSGAPEPF